MSTCQRTQWEDERGSGTVAAVGIIAVLVVLLGLVHVLAVVALANGQAARAADLAALAAADTARGLNSGDPCTVAQEVAARNDAALEHCVVGGDHPAEVQVRVSRPVEVAVLPAQLTFPQLQAAAAARAGPPEAVAQ